MRVAAATTARTLGGVILVAAGLGCGESQHPGGPQHRPKVGDPGPVHVHGLGINPRDGALFIATHTGLFRAPEGQRKAKRVADRYQDTMGFTVIGPDRFLGSGHPDSRDGLPPFLGLIESRDAGQTWKPISLLGKRDFHVLEARGQRVYGFGSDYETRATDLVVSDDGGRSWQRRDTPEGLISLAMSPQDLDHIVVSGERGLYKSRDGARGWRPLDGKPGLVAWTEADRLIAVAADGTVTRSDDTGLTWRKVGDVGGQPAAFERESADDLYVALHDGTVKHSVDKGASWSVRSAP